MQLTLVFSIFKTRTKHSFSAHIVLTKSQNFLLCFIKTASFSSKAAFWIMFWKRIAKQSKRPQARKAQALFRPASSNRTNPDIPWITALYLFNARFAFKADALHYYLNSFILYETKEEMLSKMLPHTFFLSSLLQFLPLKQILSVSFEGSHKCFSFFFYPQ